VDVIKLHYNFWNVTTIFKVSATEVNMIAEKVSRKSDILLPTSAAMCDIKLYVLTTLSVAASATMRDKLSVSMLSVSIVGAKQPNQS